MTKQILTQEKLKELLHYNSDTGIFTWASKRGKCEIGAVAGTLRPDGYRQIGLGNTSHLLHRLAFLYMEGEFPPDHVDHINRNPVDNRWCNLRHSTPHQNHENRSNNADFIGVSKAIGCSKWYAYTPKINGKQQYLGMYETHLCACYARWSYEKR